MNRILCPTDTYPLSDGWRIPAIGFGTWRLKDAEGGADVVLEALRAGYRHIDTAWFYGSEGSVGEAIRRSGLAREDVYVTTKVWMDCMGREAARKCFEESLDRLGLDYVDLLLIHWPRRKKSDEQWRQTLRETWETFLELRDQDLIRSAGVANFLPHHFEALEGMELPVIDQIECHPGYLQKETLEFCRKNGILVEAWAPLGQRRLIEHPVVCEIAAAHGRTSAQVLLRWSLQQGLLPLPMSRDASRMRSNLDVFGFELTDAEMERLSTLPEPTAWSGEHPDDHIPFDN